MRKNGKSKSAEASTPMYSSYSSECGATHQDCPNTIKGTCDREAGHSGSHSCSACRSAF